jgi:hypothetical protein
LINAFRLANPSVPSTQPVVIDPPIVCSGPWTGTHLSSLNEVNARFHWDGAHWVWDDTTACTMPPLPVSVYRETCLGG